MRRVPMRYSLCFILLEKVNQISKSFLKSSLFCVLGLIVFHIEDLKWIFESSRILFFKSIFKWNINFRVQKSWTLKFQPLSWWSEYRFLNDMSSTIANYKFFFLKKAQYVIHPYEKNYTGLWACVFRPRHVWARVSS